MSFFNLWYHNIEKVYIPRLKNISHILNIYTKEKTSLFYFIFLYPVEVKSLLICARAPGNKKAAFTLLESRHYSCFTHPWETWYYEVSVCL